MNKGFVTIATGDERYYKMALTLLRSYRKNSKNSIKFALIADRHNQYTKEFDDVIILENAKKSWMDKMSILSHCPYDENLFIDADCIVYNDINYLWDLFFYADDFSCFGAALPMNSTDGWFTKDVADIYPINFITHLHGIIYFIRKTENIKKMQLLCDEIIENYNTVKYKGFNDCLADEPVFALAMSILNFKPIERKSSYYCFVPYATSFTSDYLKRAVHYTNPKDGNVTHCDIIHWGNKNTLKKQYKVNEYVINKEYFNQKINFINYTAVKAYFTFNDIISNFKIYFKYYLEIAYKKLH